MRNTSIAFFLAAVFLLFGGQAAWADSAYRVQPGDSLFSIGKKFGVSYIEIQKANNIYSGHIYPGQTLRIPSGGPSAESYVVQPGDSLYLIAKRFGVSVPEITSLNGINNNVVYVGQTLRIPSSSAAGGTYVVQPGDSLFLIARRFGVSISEIASLNGIYNNVVYVGQALRIPGAKTTGLSSRGLSFSWRDIELLARVVNGEARGEPFEGQVAVAAVVLNRVKSGIFPSSIPGVVYQPWAFTAVHDGQINASMTSTAMQAARAALNGWDPSGGALYYWNPITATNVWVWTRQIINKIGSHVFAK